PIFTVWDISAPASIHPLATFPVADAKALKPYGSDSLLFVNGTAKTLNVLNYANLSSIQITGSVDISQYATPSSIAIVGQRAYLSCLASGIVIVNLSNPAAPVVEKVVAAHSAHDITISGNNAFV